MKRALWLSDLELVLLPHVWGGLDVYADEESIGYSHPKYRVEYEKDHDGEGYYEDIRKFIEEHGDCLVKSIDVTRWGRCDIDCYFPEENA